MIRPSIAFGALLFAAGCSGDEAAPSAEESRRLDTAENMLDEAPNQLEPVSRNLPADR